MRSRPTPNFLLISVPGFFHASHDSARTPPEGTVQPQRREPIPANPPTAHLSLLAILPLRGRDRVRPVEVVWRSRKPRSCGTECYCTFTVTVALLFAGTRS
jgi:hypothetical protein